MSDQKKKNLFSRYTYVCAIAGVAGVALFNSFRKVYWFQGIHKHIFFAAAGGYGGTKFGQWGDKVYARRDYLLYEYMDRHPEDFPEPPEKVVGETLHKWIPIR